MDRVDVAVVGAGVVGAAVAMRLAAAGRSVVVVEREARAGLGVTSRNSGVVHSGLYYPPGSLKALACVRGNALLWAWAAARGVPHRKTGKLVVATRGAQLPALEALAGNARAAGAPGARLVGGDEARALEPSVPALAALFCPETGIVDPVALCRSYLAAAEEAGAIVLLRAAVHAIARGGAGYTLDTTRGEVACAALVNAAGLFADEVARLAGVEGYRIHPCRGDYFRLRTRTVYRHLVYPVKDPASPGLGVHLTLDLEGGVRLGPDARYVAAKDDLAGGEERLEAFRAAASELLGPIEPGQLAHDGAAVRPKLRGPGDPAERDFVLAEDAPGLIDLVGIESPGLTAALDLADRVAARLG